MQLLTWLTVIYLVVLVVALNRSQGAANLPKINEDRYQANG